MNLNILKSRLKAAKTQEDVDKVVIAAAATLSANDFGHFLIKVKERRKKLPSRYGTEASL